MISVAVCTQNRAELLENVLRTLRGQTLDPARYEILVVDNNSSDSTRGVVERAAAERPNVRYLFEPEIGLSHARNRAWREAAGDYVGYLDDDCEAPPHWIEAADAIARRIAPGVFGGPYFAFYRSPKPAWFKDAYGSHSLGPTPKTLRPPEFLTGGNIFFRRDLLEAVGGFDPRHGMKGGRIGYGEETALQILIRSHHPHEALYYDPDLFVRHLVRPNKMDLRWVVRQRFASGRSSFQLASLSGASRRPRWEILLRILVAAAKLAGKSALRTVVRDRAALPYLANYWVEQGFREVECLGALVEEWTAAPSPVLPPSSEVSARKHAA
jgi:glycosyltransferase involved in cell wall biosynthesis